MKKASIILIGFALLVVVGAFLAWQYSNDLDVNPMIKNKVISFTNSNDNIYISARAWGLAGNHEEIVLSSVELTNEHRAYSKEDSYIFYTPSIYYKTEEGDKLIIYANESSISEPINFKSDIKLEIKGLTTAKELEEYAENYEKYGLIKISIFDK